MSGDGYQQQAPAFDIAEFFNGNVKAWGIVQNRKGRVVQRFTVEIAGGWEDETLVLDETFKFGVGEGPAYRRWELKQARDGAWIGTAGDIVGPAEGREYGNAFNWQYHMELPMPGSSRLIKVMLDDWMWAFDENTIVNRSYIRKFGITFAEVTLFMQKS